MEFFPQALNSRKNLVSWERKIVIKGQSLICCKDYNLDYHLVGPKPVSYGS